MVEVVAARGVEPAQRLERGAAALAFAGLQHHQAQAQAVELAFAADPEAGVAGALQRFGRRVDRQHFAAHHQGAARVGVQHAAMLAQQLPHLALPQSLQVAQGAVHGFDHAARQLHRQPRQAQAQRGGFGRDQGQHQQQDQESGHASTYVRAGRFHPGAGASIRPARRRDRARGKKMPCPDVTLDEGNGNGHGPA